MKKNAFSLIELIFSIVVIGIALLSIPAIMSVINRSAEATVQTKGYYHALAQMGVIISKPWDENNTDDWDEANVVYILQTGDEGLEICSRSSIYAEEYRRQCDKNNGNASLTLGLEGTSYNDLDDFNGNTDNDNIEGFRLQIAVTYEDNETVSTNNYKIPSAANPTGTTDIKEVTITLTDDTSDTKAYLRYYGFNIGYDKLLTKEQN